MLCACEENVLIYRFFVFSSSSSFSLFFFPLYELKVQSQKIVERLVQKQNKAKQKKKKTATTTTTTKQ